MRLQPYRTLCSYSTLSARTRLAHSHVSGFKQAPSPYADERSLLRLPHEPIKHNASPGSRQPHILNQTRNTRAGDYLKVRASFNLQQYLLARWNMLEPSRTLQIVVPAHRACPRHETHLPRLAAARAALSTCLRAAAPFICREGSASATHFLTVTDGNGDALC